MSILGKWRISEIMRFDEDKGMIWIKTEDALKLPEADKDSETLFNSDIYIDDKYIVFVADIPEGATQEEIDEAVNSGAVELYSAGRMIVGKYEYKCEDGQYLYDTGMKGEVFGEPVSSWDKLEVTDDYIDMIFYRLTRAE